MLLAVRHRPGLGVFGEPDHALTILKGALPFAVSPTTVPALL